MPVTTRYAEAFELLEGAVRTRSFVPASETELQDALESVWRGEGVQLDREVALAGAGRIDFVAFRCIGIEVKTDGSFPTIAAQVQRYAECRSIAAVLLITTKQSHASLPSEIAGKPIRVLVLRGGIS